MKNIFLLFCASLFFVCNNAIADQCAYIDADTKDSAYNILKYADSYIDFCAPCQDVDPVEKKISKLEYKTVDYIENGIQFYQIYINDEPVDVAYIYINGYNLGIISNCKPNGEEIKDVPERLNDYLTGKWILPKEYALE